LHFRLDDDNGENNLAILTTFATMAKKTFAIFAAFATAKTNLF
jgi:hypothetical protein